MPIAQLYATWLYGLRLELILYTHSRSTYLAAGYGIDVLFSSHFAIGLLPALLVLRTGFEGCEVEVRGDCGPELCLRTNGCPWELLHHLSCCGCCSTKAPCPPFIVMAHEQKRTPQEVSISAHENI